MRIIDANNGVFALKRSESHDFRLYLASQGIPCDLLASSSAGWSADPAGSVSLPTEDRLKLVHAEHIDKIEGLYRIWNVNQSAAVKKVYYAGLTAIAQPSGNRDAGMIQVVDAPGSTKQIGVASNTGKEQNGNLLYSITVFDGEYEPGNWILENGRFVQA